jgi:hypothetical protein
VGSEIRRDETERETLNEPQILKKESWFKRKIEIDYFPLILLYFETSMIGGLIVNSNINLLNKFLIVIAFLSTVIQIFLFSFFQTNLKKKEHHGNT